jgi:hypothetical protein
MSLIVDNRAVLAGEPGLHVFIAGVSKYPHMPGGGGTPAINAYGMEQLSSTALSAFKMYQWLIESKDQLPVSLATCRLLLSPSDSEVDDNPDLAAVGATRCTRENFTRAIRDWRQDSRSHADNITLFYFAGHGIQRSKADSILLLEDFANPDDGTLTNTADIVNIFYGMAPPDPVFSPAPIANAKTQLYFVDTCRLRPSEFQNFAQMSVPDVFNVELTGPDNRQAPIFYAAIPGTEGYALKNQQTLFSRALLKCLRGGAGTPSDRNDANGNPHWHVSVQSLNVVLERYFAQLVSLPRTTQEFALGGQPTGDPTIIWLKQIPLVEIELEVEPDFALQVTKVDVADISGQPIAQLFDLQNNPLMSVPTPLNPHPFRCLVEAGIYSFSAVVQPPHDAAFISRIDKPRQILPPRFVYKRRVDA